jgi:hypothetical protein
MEQGVLFHRGFRDPAEADHAPGSATGGGASSGPWVLQHGALAIQRKMVAVLGDHRVDHHPVVDKTLVDDPRPYLRPRG